MQTGSKRGGSFQNKLQHKSSHFGWSLLHSAQVLSSHCLHAPRSNQPLWIKHQWQIHSFCWAQCLEHVEWSHAECAFLWQAHWLLGIGDNKPDSSQNLAFPFYEQCILLRQFDLSPSQALQSLVGLLKLLFRCGLKLLVLPSAILWLPWIPNISCCGRCHQCCTAQTVDTSNS